MYLSTECDITDPENPDLTTEPGIAETRLTLICLQVPAIIVLSDPMLDSEDEDSDTNFSRSSLDVDSAGSPYLATGIDFWFTPKVGFRGEVENFALDITSVSGALMYKF